MKASGNTIAPYWSMVFASNLAGKDLLDMIAAPGNDLLYWVHIQVLVLRPPLLVLLLLLRRRRRKRRKRRKKKRRTLICLEVVSSVMMMTTGKHVKEPCFSLFLFVVQYGPFFLKSP